MKLKRCYVRLNNIPGAISSKSMASQRRGVNVLWILWKILIKLWVLKSKKKWSTQFIGLQRTLRHRCSSAHRGIIVKYGFSAPELGYRSESKVFPNLLLSRDTWLLWSETHRQHQSTQKLQVRLDLQLWKDFSPQRREVTCHPDSRLNWSSKTQVKTFCIHYYLFFWQIICEINCSTVLVLRHLLSRY